MSSRFREDRLTHTKLFVALAIPLLAVSRPLFAPSLWAQALVWLGYALMIAGALGRIYCSAFIGGWKNAALQQTGPFSVVRNPLYLFSFVVLVGIGLQSRMLTFLTILVASFMFYYRGTVHKEEQRLLLEFGQTYRAYIDRVPRWLPDFRHWIEPEEIQTRPKFIRRAIMDSSVFFLAMPGYALLSELQARSIFPTWLRLP